MDTIESSRQFMRMAKAIEYLHDHATRQPSLAQLAAHVHISPEHLQRNFSQWVGISPKQFLQYINAQKAKVLLQQKNSLLEVAHATGLSGTSRLHDLFIHQEGMTPGAYRNAGYNIEICYQFLPSVFGLALVAASEKSVCYVEFVEDENNLVAAVLQLQSHFELATLQERALPIHQDVQAVLLGKPSDQTIALNFKGTAFQIKVWEALLHIPMGEVVSYQQVAQMINQPTAHRAVASAIAKNHIALLIPCHRVIRSTGVIGEYRWCRARKLAMLGWEAKQQGDGHDG